MILQLFRNNSEYNKVIKHINYINEFNGILKIPTSVINPVVDIELSDYKSLESFLLLGYYENDNFIDIEYDSNELSVYTNNISIFDINYCFINEFNRYYYIKNIDCISNKIFRLYLKVDVLMSFKNDFLNLECIVERNEFDYDEYLIDSLMSYDYDKDIVVSYLPHQSINIGIQRKVFEPYNNNLKRNCVFTYVKDLPDLPGTFQPINTPGFRRLPDVNITSFGYSNTSSHRLLDDTNFAISNISKACIADDTLYSWLKHVYVYPFEVDVTDWQPLTDNIYIGKNKYIQLGEIKRLYGTKYLVERVFNWHYRTPSAKSYLDFSPFTKYELWIPYYGWVELTGENYLDKDLFLYYDVNYEEGTATANLYDGDYKILFSAPCIVGAKVSLNTANTREIETQRTAIANNTALGIISSTLTMMVGAATENPMLVVGGVAGLGKSIVTGINSTNQLYDIGKTDLSTYTAGVTNFQAVHLRKTTMKPVYTTNINEYLKYNGKPLNQNRILNNMNGFTKILEIHLENISALEDEKTELYKLLKEGIII